jgi:hypothetical protein
VIDPKLGLVRSNANDNQDQLAAAPPEAGGGDDPRDAAAAAFCCNNAVNALSLEGGQYTPKPDRLSRKINPVPAMKRALAGEGTTRKSGHAPP